jgi:hypothetical protein
MPYYPDVPGAPQNSTLGGASLWVMGGKSADEYKGVAKFFAFLSDTDRQANLHTVSGYLPITKAAYEKVKASGFYKDEPVPRDPDPPSSPTSRRQRTRSGLRLGNLVQMRDIWAEEIESALTGNKSAKAALDAATERGNQVLRQFERTAPAKTHNDIVAPDLPSGAIFRLLPVCGATRATERTPPPSRRWKNRTLLEQAAALRAAFPSARDHLRFLLLAGFAGRLAVLPDAGRLRPLDRIRRLRELPPRASAAPVLQRDGHDGGVLLPRRAVFARARIAAR